MTMSQPECEGLAAYLLDRGGWVYPVNPWDVAADLRVRVELGLPGQRPYIEFRDSQWVAVVNPLDRPERQGLSVLHEIAHVLLDRHRITNDEDHAWWLSTAILLPRHDVLRARRRGATIEGIVAANRHTSHEAAARRIVSMESSFMLWVWDAEPEPREPYRVLSPGWRWARQSPSPLEWEAMREARSSGSAVEPIGGVRAWVVTDLPWVRVFCLSDGEALLPTVVRDFGAIVD